ncbi:MAG: hypothetical protein J0H43_12500, partial [Actinobacteria bacterium]|nr:hypothetical protein [Actinomycetota bacterium]
GQAANLHTPRIAFRPFGGGGLWMRTSLVVMPDVPTRRLTPLLDACVALVAAAPAGLRAPIDHRG